MVQNGAKDKNIANWSKIVQKGPKLSKQSKIVQTGPK